jgi:hypothetical protein
VYFSYKGVRFKFIENDPRKWSDVLLTIVADRHQEETAYSVAGEWASALSWELQLPVSVRALGAKGVGATFRLRQARCNTRSWPVLPFHGSITGYDFSRVASISSEQQRLALAVYREAQCSNNVLLSILLYWQILEIGNPKSKRWINRAITNYPAQLASAKEYVSRLPLKSRKLADYLEDDCRHAIAHIKRRPGRMALTFDSIEEIGRLNLSEATLRDLARVYIGDQLKVTDRSWLVRAKGRGFPTYVGEKDAQAFYWGR